MAPAGEIAVEKRGDAGLGHVASDEPCAEREHVGVVMLAGELGRERIADPSAAALRVAVHRDRDSDAGAAYGDATLGLAGCDRSRQPRAILRIIDALRPVGPEVRHLVALLTEPARELIFEEVPGV